MAVLERLWKSTTRPPASRSPETSRFHLAIILIFFASVYFAFARPAALLLTITGCGASFGLRFNRECDMSDNRVQLSRRKLSPG